MNRVISFTEEMKQHHITMDTTYCKMENVHPPIQIEKSLGIKINDFCYYLTRARCVGFIRLLI